MEKNVNKCRMDGGGEFIFVYNRAEHNSSVYSQIIRKLKQKGWVKQVCNEHNNRKYNLFFTEAGWQVFRDHDNFRKSCYKRTFQGLAAGLAAPIVILSHERTRASNRIFISVSVTVFE